MSIRLVHQGHSNLIVTPNNILEAVAEFSVYQWRIYAAIILLMHEETKRSFEHGQIVITEFLQKDIILLNIPLSKISKPSEYRDVKESLLAMSKINCEIVYSECGKKQIMSGSLFTVDIPVVANWKSSVRIRLHPQVAELLLTFQRDFQGRPIFYSFFRPDIIFILKSTYQIKLYYFLCSWRNKATRHIKIEELYRLLGIVEKYSAFSDFKKHILLPCYKVLHNRGDVWFDINDKSFLKKDGQRVISLSFKIVTAKALAEREIKIESIKTILKTHFNFDTAEIEELRGIFESAPYDRISHKISELHDKITSSINHPKRYIIKSLKEEFRKRGK